MKMKMKMHMVDMIDLQKAQRWLARSLVVTLVASVAGCDAGDDAEDIASEGSDEDDDASEDEGDFRTICARPANPSADINTTLAGAATSVTREGSGSGAGCDLFTVRVATPAGHRAREIVIEGDYDGIVDAAAYAWRRSCTTNEPILCTVWTNLALDPLEVTGGDFELGGMQYFFGMVDGGGDIPANTYSDILVGARVEWDNTSTSLPIEITVSE